MKSAKNTAFSTCYFDIKKDVESSGVAGRPLNSALRFWERSSEELDWRRVVPDLGGSTEGWSATSVQSLVRRILPLAHVAETLAAMLCRPHGGAR